MVIGGANFALQMAPAEDGWRQASICVRFPASLSAGRYHITLKLLQGGTEDTSQLIEKQVGLLSFDMLPNNRGFLGVVDLGLQSVVQPPEQQGQIKKMCNVDVPEST